MPSQPPSPSTEDDGPATRAEGVGCFLLGGLVTLLVAGVVVVAARHFEDRRVSRIEHAEDKYGLTYVRGVGDGEGGGLWRTSDGATVSCSISGRVPDPVLSCGTSDLSQRDGTVTP